MVFTMGKFTPVLNRTDRRDELFSRQSMALQAL